ncbi:MBL fold metallo-hydrolase [Pelagicoccus albus]|uniref:MBL fold metallo-hydrolase n=1 Tax=Pelagicoccus albus TaxID=415222 RepID=A0A7X1BAY5_9BACT|nr:MBL fold metallo-hydrolase [Pelagicoccus albus]MBC2607635.1 MBL fold metallo-hydrolase [Pelagicoccus albus]
MILPVEDEFSDILSKAQKGQGISTAALAEQCGVDENEIRAARRGVFDEAVIKTLGKALHLNVPALVEIGKGSWRPREQGQIKGFALVTSPFHQWLVNSFLVWDSETKRAIAFDTGSVSLPMIEFMESKGLSLDALILTHAHWDHYEGAPDLKKRWPEARVFMGRKDQDIPFKTEAMDEGFSYNCDSIKVTAFDTPGHTVGGMSFRVEGLEQPLAIVGDALFAGSMGGANTSYEDAIRSLERILSLDETTVLAPGHGPLTSVAEERQMNCFAASSLPWNSSEI